MPPFLLRVDATNLGAVIDDTDDLSTRRGGGLLALFAVGQMPTTYDSVTLTAVATGASIGLFAFDATEAEADAIAEQVRTHFRRASLTDEQGVGVLPLAHATFAVDVRPASAASATDVQHLIAANRWRQLREPTVALDGVWPTPAAADPCHFDRVRPATTDVRLPENLTVRASSSVADRRRFGRAARQRFYTQELGHDAHAEFTQDFRELAGRDGLAEDQAPTNTLDKLAVLYLDGNQFGAMQRQALGEGLDAYRTWSDALRAHHQTLLRELITLAADDPAWQTSEGKLRLETLLWGGDEIIWVGPAWKGWELAEWFFRRTSALRTDLTYSAGLVFCHVNAPINNIVALAKRLGEAAKAVEGKHRLAYEVLESFDDVSGDFDTHRRLWLPSDVSAAQLILDPDALTTLMEPLSAVARGHDFPTRQLYRLVHAWRQGDTAGAAAAQKRLHASEAGAHVRAIETTLGATAWLHLLNVLPYWPAGDAS